MKRIHHAVIAIPLLFVGACADIADDGNAESSTSQDLSAPPTPEPRAPSGSSPTISPANSAPGADFELVPPGGTYSCASGTLCTGVWDPSVGEWKVFKLFFCNTYALSHWIGPGFYLDNQTGNPTSTFLDQSGHVLRSFRPGGGQVNVNWDPVWFIKNC